MIQYDVRVEKKLLSNPVIPRVKKSCSFFFFFSEPCGTSLGPQIIYKPWMGVTALVHTASSDHVWASCSRSHCRVSLHPSYHKRALAGRGGIERHW